METNAIEKFKLLEPQTISLNRVAGIAELSIEGGLTYAEISVARAFPISDPDRYIGFLDSDGKDIGIVKDPDLLDPDSQRIVAEELELRYFVPVIEKVVSVKEEF